MRKSNFVALVVGYSCKAKQFGHLAAVGSTVEVSMSSTKLNWTLKVPGH